MAHTSHCEEPFSTSTSIEEKQPHHSTPALPEIENDTIPQADAEQLEEEDVQSLLAVSISRAQSRLTSPRTPAAEKVAALEHIDGGGFFTEFGKETGEEDPDDSADTAGIRTSQAKIPYPWQASPKEVETTTIEDPDHKNSTSISHQRNSVGAQLPSPENAFKRLVTSPLNSLPKPGNFANFFPHQIPFFTSNSGSEKPSQIQGRSKRSNSLFPNTNIPFFSIKSDSQNTPDQLLSVDSPHLETTEDPHYRNFYAVDSSSVERTTSSSLHRASSDGSLRLSRNLSRVSSLGNDALFHNVQGQVNSRFKAIKDSFADSSFKFSNLPSKLLPSSSIKGMVMYRPNIF